MNSDDTPRNNESMVGLNDPMKSGIRQAVPKDQPTALYMFTKSGVRYYEPPPPKPRRRPLSPGLKLSLLLVAAVALALGVSLCAVLL